MLVEILFNMSYFLHDTTLCQRCCSSLGNALFFQKHCSCFVWNFTTLDTSERYGDFCLMIQSELCPFIFHHSYPGGKGRRSKKCLINDEIYALIFLKLLLNSQRPEKINLIGLRFTRISRHQCPAAEPHNAIMDQLYMVSSRGKLY